MSDPIPDWAGPDDGRTMRERMLAGDLYRVDEELGDSMRTARRLARRYAEEYDHDDAAARTTLLELLGSVGPNVDLRPPIYVDYGSNTSIGEWTFANYGLMLLDVAPITIGKECQIGPNVQLLTPVHPVDPEQRRTGWESAKPITLGDNVWLGGGVIVCPGVSIGDNSVIGAGSVVVKDIPANVVAVGNPARVVKHLDIKEPD